MGTDYMQNVTKEKVDALATALRRKAEAEAEKESFEMLQQRQKHETLAEPCRFIGCVTYTHKDTAAVEETQALAKIARTLDNMRGATVITHPTAWITDANGIQAQGTASLIFGTWNHKVELRRVVHEIYAMNVNNIIYVEA